MIITTLSTGNESLSNCYLLRDESTGKCAVVDPGGFLMDVRKTAEAERDNIEYILLTHGHFDHLLGLPYIKKVTGGKVAVGAQDEICLSDRDANLMTTFNVDVDFIPVKADIALNDGDEIRIGDSVIKVMATPGHSKGGVIYIDEDSKSIISGDTLFHSTVGRTDTYGADPAQMEESLKKIIALEGDYTVYPGHGPQTQLSRERVRNIYIRRMSR